MAKEYKINRAQNFKKSNPNYNASKGKRNKLTNESILDKLNFSFSRDAEWFKKTMQKIDSVKNEIETKFYTPEKKAQKYDFLNKLKLKLKDYKDALQYEEKYKKIRFFERRKLERMLTKNKKEIQKIQSTETEENKNNLNELNEKQKKIISDINYVKYYPKTYKYYSLYPNKDKDNPETLKKIEKMRKKIEFYLNRKTKFKGNNINETEELSEGDAENLENQDANPLSDAGEDNLEKLKNKETQNNSIDKPKKQKKEFSKKDNLDYEKEVNMRYTKNNIEEDDFFIVDD